MAYKYDSLAHELLYATRLLLQAQQIETGDKSLILRDDALRSELDTIKEAQSRVNSAVLTLDERRKVVEVEYYKRELRDAKPAKRKAGKR